MKDLERSNHSLCHSTISRKGVCETKKKKCKSRQPVTEADEIRCFPDKEKKSNRNRLDKVGNAPASSTQDTDSNTGIYLALFTEYSKLPSVPKGQYQDRTSNQGTPPPFKSFQCIVHYTFRYPTMHMLATDSVLKELLNNTYIINK